MKSQSRKLFHSLIAIIGLALLTSGSSALAQQAESQVMTTTQEAPKLPSGELDSLVAPIALIPINSSLKRWLLPLIHWRSSNFSSRWIGTRI